MFFYSSKLNINPVSNQPFHSCSQRSVSSTSLPVTLLNLFWITVHNFMTSVSLTKWLSQGALFHIGGIFYWLSASLWGRSVYRAKTSGGARRRSYASMTSLIVIGWKRSIGAVQSQPLWHMHQYATKACTADPATLTKRSSNNNAHRWKLVSFSAHVNITLLCIFIQQKDVCCYVNILQTVSCIFNIENYCAAYNWH